MTTDTRITFDEPDLDVREVSAEALDSIRAQQAAKQAEARRIQAEEKRRAEEQELLAKVKLEQPPTAEEAKALLEARRVEIRHAVLTEADKRDWCIDGTRKVCANLRLERPGDRPNRAVEVEFTVKMTMNVLAYTEEGAAQRLFHRSVLSQKWLTNQLYASELAVTPIAIAIDGKPVDLSSIEADPKPEVSA